MNGALLRVRLIAGQAVLEAVRQRFFHALALLALGLVLVAGFLQDLDFGGDGVKFLADIGIGGIVFFGSILAIVATAQLFFSELGSRTAQMLLAKPVGRFEFLCGKFLGLSALLLVFVGVLTLALACLLLQSGGPDLRYGDLVVFAFLQWLRLSLLAAITLFIASYSRSALFCIVSGFVVLLICQLQHLAREAYAGEAGVFAVAAGLAALVFPNFEVFNLKDAWLLPSVSAPGPEVLIRIAAYALAYLPVFLLLANWSFSRREI